MSNFRAKQCKIIQHFPIKYALTDWIYGWLHCSFDGSFFTYISNINDEKMETETYSVESSTVCQNTGLKDKTGKEIYEKDLLKGHNGFIYRVWLVKGGFAINVPVEKFKNDIKMDYPFPLQPLADEQTCSYIESQCEIIGNIIENPEFLQ